MSSKALYLQDVAYLLLAMMCTLNGCTSDAGSGNSQLPMQSVAASLDEQEALRDSVLTYIEEMHTEAFLEAYDALQHFEFTRYLRTEQFDDDNFLVAFDERTVRHAGPTGNRTFTELSMDSSGTYDFGYFRGFVSSNVEDQDPQDLTPFLFPEDPSYLSERNYEAYSYRFAPDSLMGAVAARVIVIRALPEKGDGRNIREARYYVDPSTRQLIAFRLKRIDLALFFREESTFFVHLQETRDGVYVPYNTRFETRIIMPFKPAQRFRTVSTYSDLVPVSA